VLLTWNRASQGSFPLRYYRVYRSESSGGPYTPAQTVEGCPLQTGATIGGLVNGRTYHFVVKAEDTEGNASDYSAEVSAKPVSVPPPSGIQAYSGPEQVSLYWVPPSGLTYPPPSGYHVYRGDESGGPYGQIDPSLVTVPHYVDGAVGQGNIYYYVLRTVDSDAPPNQSLDSGEASGGPGALPGKPANLAVTEVGASHVSLDWDAAEAGTFPLTDYVACRSPTSGGGYVAGHQVVTLNWSPPSENPSDVAGYTVYRGLAPGQEAANPIATLPATARSYVDRGLVNGRAYYFLRAYDFDTPIPNYSRRSAEVTATPGAGGRKLALLALSTDPEAILFIGNSRTVVNGADVHSNGGGVAQGSATVQINADVYAVGSITGNISTPGHANYPNLAQSHARHQPGQGVPSLPRPRARGRGPSAPRAHRAGDGGVGMDRH